MGNSDLVKLGSQTAKGGFKNEYDVIDKFNAWRTDKDAQNWLQIMGYKLNEIEKVEAYKVKGNYKADVQAKVKIYLKDVICVQNLSVKLVSNLRGYNQIDKRWVDKYKELWNIPDDVTIILKKFCGEIPPEDPSKVRDSRRMFFDEMDQEEQEKVLDFFKKNKMLIVSDILKGRGKFSAEWMLVVKKTEDTGDMWVLKPMNVVMNYFSQGDVKISSRGSLRIGRITMQRKGGDNGRSTANMMQFKINPAELFDI